MPLPFLLLGAAAVTGLLGLKKGADAVSDNRRARGLLEEAQAMFDEAKEELERAREKTTQILEKLGALKLQVWHRQLGRFVRLFEQVRNVELTGRAASEFRLTQFTQRELADMKQMSLRASEIVSSGVAAAGTGALVGMASYGGAMMLATASTGTAISTLSGAAAANATLAWFGGGSLATGGLGIAGGTAILGGIVAGPVLAVGGVLMAARARENLAKARSSHSEATRAVAEMETATSVVWEIGVVGEDFTRVITEVDNRMTGVLDNMEAAIQVARKNIPWWRKLFGATRPAYKRMTEEQKRTLHCAIQFVQVVKVLLETPLLTKEGALDEECHKALKQGQLLLEAGWEVGVGEA